MAQKKVNEYEQTYDVSRQEGETQRQYAIRLFKTADQRLVRLQQYAKEPGFEHVQSYAYAKAMKELQGFGQRRFNAKIADPDKQPKLFRAKLAVVKEFLTSPSSTKEGIKSIYGNKADKINATYGTKFTTGDMGDFFESGVLEKLVEKTSFGSKTVLRAIGNIQRARKVIDSIQGNTNFTISGIDKENALAVLRKRSQWAKLGLTDAKDRKKLRDLIKNASEWVDASETDIEDYFND